MAFRKPLSRNFGSAEIVASMFIGEEIQIHVSEEQDLSGKYQELSKERAELWKRCQKTDSKKKEAQLQDQVHELDRKINQYWELSDIEDLNYAN